MKINSFKKNFLSLLLLSSLAFAFGCGTQSSPGGKPGQNTEMLTRWESYLNEPGWASVNMVKLDIIITEQERIQRYVSNIISAKQP